ncbi:MAG: ATP-dependent sacrificial sulfur transferase LarE [Lachnospiraceae bacterium]|nr:ATP-dependent sacrificial sulfur transferase LarE [Lachnospiraceae bacterium]
MRSTDEKLNKLKEYIRKLESVGVAFSSGVDSTFLLKTAHDVLGDKCVAITARSISFPQKEQDEAALFCKEEKIRHITFDSLEFQNSVYLSNPVDRCYHCKKVILSRMIGIAKEEGLQTVIEGSNADDDGNYRPGARALKELNVLSPLKDCGLTKKEIRQLSFEMGLKTYDKPSYPCLSTRIPYGEKITPEKIGMIKKAEELLSDLGFGQLRVRMHEVSKDHSIEAGKDHYLARIEVMPDDIVMITETQTREKILAGFKEIGFLYVTLDLAGYRMGSMDEVHL